MFRGLLHRAFFVHQAFQMHIKMETTLATRTIFQMLLHDSDFLVTEFPVDIEMKTSNGLHAIHDASSFFHDPASRPPLPAHRQLLCFSVHSRSEEHTSELQSRFDLVC